MYIRKYTRSISDQGLTDREINKCFGRVRESLTRFSGFLQETKRIEPDFLQFKSIIRYPKIVKSRRTKEIRIILQIIIFKQ